MATLSDAAIEGNARGKFIHKTTRDAGNNGGSVSGNGAPACWMSRHLSVVVVIRRDVWQDCYQRFVEERAEAIVLS